MFPCFFKERQCRMSAEKAGVKVRGHYLAPLVDGDRLKGLEQADAGIAHEDVERSEPLDCRVRHGLIAARDGDIGGERQRAVRPQLGGQGLQAFLPPAGRPINTGLPDGLRFRAPQKVAVAVAVASVAGARELGAGGDVKFGVDVLQVVLDGPGAEEQLGGDLPGGEPAAGELADLRLLRRERRRGAG